MYSLSTDVLGILVSRALGMPLDEVLKQRVFEPLDMRHTSHSLSEIEAQAKEAGDGDVQLNELYEPTKKKQVSGRGRRLTGTPAHDADADADARANANANANADCRLLFSLH